MAYETSHIKRGFTLIEMIISLALFSFVMLGTTAVLLSVVDGNRKAQALKTTINNLSVVLDSMARNLRTGTAYYCGMGSKGSTRDCKNNADHSISFIAYDGSQWAYQLNQGGIEVSKENVGGGAFSVITAPEITIDRLDFYVDGTGSNDQTQPHILISIGGYINNIANKKQKTQTRFDVQTMVSQRVIDDQ